MKCNICGSYNIINIIDKLWRCNECGHKFFGVEDVEGDRAGFCREAEVQDRDAIENSEGDGLMTLDEGDELFPPDEF